MGEGHRPRKDPPNFVANRVGVFSMLATMVHTERFALGFDVVDALTGPAIGRARSATYRTSDVVGLDTMAHVIRTMDEALPDDPWHRYYQAPVWLKALIDQGALGQKTKAGFFRKIGKEIEVLDRATQTYRSSKGEIEPEVAAILALKTPAEQFAQLRQHAHPQAQFLWAIFRDLFHYCAYHLATIADNARDVDLAIRWGFGWKMGRSRLGRAPAGGRCGVDGRDVDAGRRLLRWRCPLGTTGRGGGRAHAGGVKRRRRYLPSALEVARLRANTLRNRSR